MNAQQFITYAHGALSDQALEPLYERISEHNGEVARFGDSWPGALLQINSCISTVRKIEAQLARLEGRAAREFRFSVSSPQ